MNSTFTLISLLIKLLIRFKSVVNSRVAISMIQNY